MKVIQDYSHDDGESEKEVLVPEDMSALDIPALTAEFRMILQKSGVNGEDLKESAADFVKFILRG
jgi:hypothetical protein